MAHKIYKLDAHEQTNHVVQLCACSSLCGNTALSARNVRL